MATTKKIPTAKPKTKSKAKPAAKSFLVTHALVDALTHLYRSGNRDVVTGYRGVSPHFDTHFGPQSQTRYSDEVSMGLNQNGLYLVLDNNNNNVVSLSAIAMTGGLLKAVGTHKGNVIDIRGDVEIELLVDTLFRKRAKQAKKAYDKLAAPIDYDNGDFVRFKVLNEEVVGNRYGNPWIPNGSGAAYTDIIVFVKMVPAGALVIVQQSNGVTVTQTYTPELLERDPSFDEPGTVAAKPRRSRKTTH